MTFPQQCAMALVLWFAGSLFVGWLLGKVIHWGEHT